ncbi:MAG TPA: hypothetical protein VES95_04920 [Dermatophilaceae bacterium]|nr:hypothetical protein [Dermatophilaceae bacterium]
MSTHTTTPTTPTTPTPQTTTTPQTPQTPTAPAAPRRRPGTAGYWVGALVTLVATLGALLWGAGAFLGWRAHIEDFPRVTVPGAAVVTLTDTGTRILYVEHDRSITDPAVPAITVTAPSGATVPVSAYSGEMRYDVPGATGRVGDAVAVFTATEPGAYRLTIPASDTDATVAVGDDLVWGWGPQLAGIVALFLGGLVAGLALVVVTAARRSGPTS